MRLAELKDCAMVLFYHRNMINEAFVDGVQSGLWDRTRVRSFEALKALGIVLQDGALNSRLRQVIKDELRLDDVSGTSYEAWKRVAAREKEWFDPDLASEWYVEAARVR